MIRQSHEQAYEYQARLDDGSQWCAGCLYAVDRLHARLKLFEQLPPGAWVIHARPIQRRRWARLKAWPAARWTAIASVVIALCALGVSFQQGSAIRKHQRLSVRPWVGTSFYHNEEGAGFVLLTIGPGLAFVRTFEVFVDETPQPHWDAVAEALRLPPPSAAPRYTFSMLYPGWLLEPNASGKIFWIPPGPAAETLKQERSRVGIIVCYCSLYEECWRWGIKHNEQVRTCTPLSDVKFDAPPMKPTTFDSTQAPPSGPALMGQ